MRDEDATKKAPTDYDSGQPVRAKKWSSQGTHSFAGPGAQHGEAPCQAVIYHDQRGYHNKKSEANAPLVVWKMSSLAFGKNSIPYGGLDQERGP
jgi:hypothetical protein